MSRFSDDYDEDYPNEQALWWANIERSFDSKRGTESLHRFIKALDALPERALAHGVLRDAETGNVCAIGALALDSGTPRERLTTTDEAGPLTLAKLVARETGLPWATLYRLEAENDEGVGGWSESAQDRWTRLRKWAVDELRRRGETVE